MFMGLTYSTVCIGFDSPVIAQLQLTKMSKWDR